MIKQIIINYNEKSYDIIVKYNDGNERTYNITIQRFYFIFTRLLNYITDCDNRFLS